jgi:transcriptional regulator with XRE-family HTH domain
MKERGISQHALARELGISQPTVRNWVTGVNPPKPSNVSDLCQALGVRRDWLVHGDGAKDLPKPNGMIVREDDPGFREVEKVTFIMQNGSADQKEAARSILDALAKQVRRSTARQPDRSDRS